MANFFISQEKNSINLTQEACPMNLVKFKDAFFSYSNTKTNFVAICNNDNGVKNICNYLDFKKALYTKIQEDDLCYITITF